MTESLLHYIWRFRHYRPYGLFTTEQQPVEVIHPGIYNLNQGPDFLNARIRIGGQTWVGHVELHIKSSDWQSHGHGADSHYQNVILHVVWMMDREIILPFPTLELAELVPKWLLDQYDALMQAQSFIPCEKQIGRIRPMVLDKWKETVLMERLQQKAADINSSLQKNQFHWEESFWCMLAKNFGFPVNSELFEAVASSIPIRVLTRHKNQLIQLEALLFGQAGLLEKKFTEHYPILLQKEYRFLQKKYGLERVSLPVHFLRMRPANFPTIRLAQLAALIHHSKHLFSSLREEPDCKQAQLFFQVCANDYWNDHYLPEVQTGFSVKATGRQFIENIFINTVIPFLYAYGSVNRIDILTQRAIRWLEELPGENNRICRGFEKLGMNSKQAFDSQALIHMKKEYCDLRRCLNCAIGNELLKEI